MSQVPFNQPGPHRVPQRIFSPWTRDAQGVSSTDPTILEQMRIDVNERLNSVEKNRLNLLEQRKEAQTPEAREKFIGPRSSDRLLPPSDGPEKSVSLFWAAQGANLNRSLTMLAAVEGGVITDAHLQGIASKLNWKDFDTGADAVTIEQANRDLAAVNLAKAEIRADMRETYRLQWMARVLDVTSNFYTIGYASTVPALIRSTEFPSDSLGNPTQEDVDFVAQVLLEVQKSSRPIIRDAPTAEEARGLINSLEAGYPIPSYGLMKSSGLELNRRLREFEVAQLPTGMTEEEFKGALGAASYTPDEIEQVTDAIAIADNLIEEWHEGNVRRQIIHDEEFKDLELDELIEMINSAKWETVTSEPGIAMMLPADYWRTKIAKPWTGNIMVQAERFRRTDLAGGMAQRAAEQTLSRYPSAATKSFSTEWNFSGLAVGFNKPIGSTERSERALFGQDRDEYKWDRSFRAAQERGFTDWEAMGVAFEEWDTSGFNKFTAEVLLDPITYFGFGIYAKILKPIPYLRALGGAERAFIRATDWPFKMLQSGGSFLGRKTVGQLINNATNKTIHALLKGIESIDVTHGIVPYRKLTSVEVAKRVRLLANYSLSNPHDGTIASSAGQALLLRNPLSKSDLREFIRRLNVVQTQLTPDQMATRQVADVITVDADEVLAKFDTAIQTWGIGTGGRASSPEEIASFLTKLVGRETTGELGQAYFRVANAFMQEQNGILMKNLDALIDEASSNNTILSITKHIRATLDADITSEVRDARFKWLRMTAAVTHAGHMANVIGATKLSSLMHSFARMYLLFAAYPVMNTVETVLKTAFRNINPFYYGDTVAELNAAKAGLYFPTDLFDPDVIRGIDLQTGAINKAIRSKPERLTGMSDNTVARLRRETRRSFIDYTLNIPDEIFIKAGGRINLKMQANYLLRGMERELIEKNPDSMLRTAQIPLAHLGLLSTFSMEQQEWIVKETSKRLAIDPARVLHMSDDFTPRVIDAQNVSKLINESETLFPSVREYLNTESDAGRLIPAIDRLMEDATEITYQEILASPQLVRQQLRRLVDEQMAKPIESVDDLYHMSVLLQELDELYGSSISYTLRVARKNAERYLNSKHRSEFYTDLWDDTLDPFLVSGEEDFLRLTVHLKGQTQRPDLNLSNAQKSRYDDLITAHAAHIKLIRNTRNEQHRVELRELMTKQDAIEKGPDAVSEWWQGFYRKREAVWDEAEGIERTASAEVTLADVRIEDLDSQILPDVSRNPFLTPSDIGSLYGVIPQEISRTIFRPEFTLLRTKEDWVKMVLAKARRLGVKNKVTPTQMGFTRERVGYVYDTLAGELKGSTAVSNIAKPHLDQIKLLQNNVTLYSKRKNALFPLGGKDKLSEYSAAVYDDLLRQEGVVAPYSGMQGTFIPTTPQVADPYDVVEGTLLTPAAAAGTTGVDVRIPRGSGGLTPPEPTPTAVPDAPVAEAPTVQGQADINRQTLRMRQEAAEAAEVIDPNLADLEGVVAASDEMSIPALSRVEDVFDESTLVDPGRRELYKDYQTVGEVKGVRLTSPEWQTQRQEALDRIYSQYKLDFPVYDDPTSFNQLAHTIFPFWSYEAHRLPWLLRTYIQKPGVYMGQDRYKDYTDDGYVTIPSGVPIIGGQQVNFLRGTIFMGGFRRLTQRDFPDYYDRYGGFSGAIDQASRYGFYPNVAIQAFQTFFGAKEGRPQTGELMIPMFGTALEGFIAAQDKIPGKIGQGSAMWIHETLLPGKFKDYMIANEVSKIDGPGKDILDKINADVELSPEEEDWWYQGLMGVTTFDLYNTQMGMMRMRPAERTEYLRRKQNLVKDLYNVSIKQQNEAYKYGLKLSDWLPLSPSERDMFRELEGAEEWSGMATYLQESEVGHAYALTTQYFSEVRDNREIAQPIKQDLDRRLQLPVGDAERINLDTWKTELKKIDTELRISADALKHSSRYEGAVIDFEDRKQFALDHDKGVMMQHPVYELISMYMDIQPEFGYNSETGQTEMLWNDFFNDRRRFRESLPSSLQEEITEIINRWDTPLQRRREEDFQLLTPYFNAERLVMLSFTSDEQTTINTWKRSDDYEEKIVLADETSSSGDKIIAKYTRDLSNTRDNIREVMPQLDARLVIWEGRVPKTEAAADIARNLRRSYGLSVDTP
jgi:hypothetical protein